MARPFLAIAVLLALAPAVASPAFAQSSLAERLQSERLGAARTGTYQAGDHITFMLDRDGAHYLLRFAGDPEIFVLYADHTALGGRVLKYDTNQSVLGVAGWGAITLYTANNPNGLPATRIGDSTPPAAPDVSLDALMQAASDEAEHLAYTDHLAISFSTDWNGLAADPGLRALCFDTIENTGRGLERFAASPAGAHVLKGRVNAVLVQTSGRPTLQLRNGQLIVTYDPSQGYAGRASSRAIAHALGTIFGLKAAQN
ncbi:MAG: DUF4908 domain-containing protein [Alphaproteobacteria bacterium]|nr:DUF4908 domain-containing protein [Alphaproteobacteria bacterium]MBU6472004.1 DUF4908 domain-containing protein [Alphaproteobacteria bacterium]MDE2012176.1 DUF4908 domain-containing protein [Alphaproteobacteria bacterium]MDE2072189.1 DUF4908 domain-containing protein [Alphaproteobacteria bacterium]MDE2351762.1 DUF4908 domain-containing protein [Alphaproteobacteria bacterium]